MITLILLLKKIKINVPTGKYMNGSSRVGITKWLALSLTRSWIKIMSYDMQY